MAPTTSDLDSHESSFLYSLLPVMNLRRRDSSGNSTLPTSTVAGFVAVIAILCAIIIGYIAYRLFKRYQARGQPTHRPATSPTSLTGSTRLKHGVAPTEITITGSNYDGFPSMAQSKHGHAHSHSQSQHQPADFSIDPHTANNNAGSKTPNLDWRPPVLTPWSKHSLQGSDSELEAQQQRPDVPVHASSSNTSIPYPSQAYAAHGRKRGPGGGGGVFGFMRSAANGFANGGGRRKGSGRGDDEGVYLMVGANSPPVGSPPPQYVTKNGVVGKRSLESNNSTVQPNGKPEETVGAYLRAHAGGAMSPPLPPLPSTTPDILRKSSDRQAPSAYNNNAIAGPSGKSVPAPINVAPRTSSSSSRPLSRVPTKKSSRLTASSSLNGHGAVPSPRVSSLFRASTRLSHHHPASPGLPNPPPMPAIPAHLQHLSRSTSTSRTGSTAGSLDVQPKHASSLSAASTMHAAGGDTSVVIGPDGPEDPTKGPDGKPLPRTMVVTCTFTPSMSDELPLAIGETVSMLEEYIDEWCFVQRVRVMIKEGVQRAGIEVGVHGTVDVQNTVVVPVPGEGNLGAVPRFCLSEWPLALMEEEEEEEEGQEPITLGQETPTGLPMFTPPAILPSPPGSSTTPTFIPGKQVEPARQPPSNPYSSQPTPSQSRPRPLPTPTPKLPTVIPEESLDSKFSSWGSTSTNMPLPMQTFSGLGTPTPGQQQAKDTSHLGANSIHPLATDSRTPSVSSAATSLTAPIPPPTSPVSQSPVVISPAEEDDNIKRVSKPPLAPRASRFPPTLDEQAPVIPSNFLPNLLGRSIGHGHSRNNSRSNASGMTAEGGIPRAAERTVTMPPLPRRPSETDPSTADTPTTATPTFQLSHTIGDYNSSRNGSNTSLNNANNVNNNISGMKEANAHWAGVYTSKEHNASGTGMNTPSTSAAETPNTGAGTSAGSKTPSTAASALTASTSSNNYSPPGKAGFGARPPGPMGSSGNVSYGARALPSAQDKKGGASKVNIKSFRTGSMMGSGSVPR